MTKKSGLPEIDKLTNIYTDFVADKPWEIKSHSIVEKDKFPIEFPKGFERLRGALLDERPADKGGTGYNFHEEFVYGHLKTKPEGGARTQEEWKAAIDALRVDLRGMSFQQHAVALETALGYLSSTGAPEGDSTKQALCPTCKGSGKVTYKRLVYQDAAATKIKFLPGHATDGRPEQQRIPEWVEADLDCKPLTVVAERKIVTDSLAYRYKYLVKPADDSSAKFAELNPREVSDAVTAILDGSTHCNATGYKTGLYPLAAGDWQKLRPHMVFAVASCHGGWVEVKDRCFGTFHEGHDHFEAPAAQGRINPADAASSQAAKDQPVRRALLLTIIHFRNEYFKEAIRQLKTVAFADSAATREAKKPRLVAKSVGSTDLTSDFDITFGGSLDVDGVAEINHFFRTVWGKESGYIFDTNFYVRDWSRVANKILVASENPAPADNSLQWESDEQVDDLLGLAKIRRYASSAEWYSLVKAIRRDVIIDGIKADEPAAADKAHLARFARLDKADELFTKQFVEPILKRLEADKTAILKANEAHLGEDGKKALAEVHYGTYERLNHLDANATLRACNFAYIELCAVARAQAEAAIKANAGSEKIGQMFDKKRTYEESGMNAAGLFYWTDVASKLTGEAVLFAAEAYNTQGALWDVVGAQGGDKSYNITHDLFLHCFNEQVGDALKELREYQVKFRGDPVIHLPGTKEAEAARQAATRTAAASPAADEKGKNTKGAFDYVATTADIGFFRASKYELRMLDVIENLRGKLAADPVIASRIKAFKQLFPGKTSPDEEDLDLLRQEGSFAGIWKSGMDELLRIRKAKGEYAETPLAEKRELAKAILQSMVEVPLFKEGMREKLTGNKPNPRWSARLDYDDFFEKDKAKSGVKDGKEPDTGRTAAELKASADAFDNWGLRELANFLLMHCAMVNKVARRMLSRPPLEVAVSLTD